MASAPLLGPYSRASALSCKAYELEFRGHDERSIAKFREALAAARAVGVEDCLVTAFLTVKIAEREVGLTLRRLNETGAVDGGLSFAAKMRECAEAITGAAAVARRRRAAGATQPAEQAWYVVCTALIARLVRGCSESLALEAANRLASLGSDTTVFAACTLLSELGVLLQFPAFSSTELPTTAQNSRTSRLNEACDLVDEAVALTGPQRVKDTLSGHEAALKMHLRKGVELWRLKSSTAAHAVRLEEALQQLGLNGTVSADEHARYVQEMEVELAMTDAARAVASAPELLRSCALASCGAKEAHVKHFSKCAACKTVVYCSKTCQTADWPAHKKACKAARKAAEEAKAASAGA